MSKVNPAISIVLDKERHLLLDLNAMVAIEEETGMDFQEFVKKIAAGKMSIKELRLFLWACLIHEDEKLTQKQVGSWIHTGTMDEISAKLISALKEALPEPKEAVDDDAPLAQSTG